MTFVPFASPTPLQIQAATPAAGFALQNGTPTIISWTAPNDGQNHRVLILGEVSISVLEVGGAIQAAYTPPAGGAQVATLNAGGLGISVSALTVFARVVGPGTTVQVNQSSALTAGTATVWAEIWGS
jgi:hypothetical protein